MRLKLCPNLHFSRHTDASNLRDNTGWLSRARSEEVPLSLNISSAAVRGDADDADYIPEEDLRNLSEQEIDGGTDGKEKLVLSQECHLVTLMSAVKGRFDITTTHVYFHDLSPVKDDLDRQDFKWPLPSLREIYLRRYNLRRSALEIFLIDQTNYFLNFTTKTRNRVVSRLLGLRPPNLAYNSSRSPADLLRASGLTQKWVNHEITNFEYLMQLNTIAGRTYNDLSQYPVFPWIIADYTSEELDLNNPDTFRDLSKPIGVVNPRNEADVKMKYDSFEDPSGTIAKFHYGTHYSNSAGVLHYLVRVEPFASLHIELQSGRFDVADRQFHSIPQTWKLLMDNPNDVKELIPEFFYFPEFLKNLNQFDLGLLQGTKDRVNDVDLPKWASSAEDFIYKHRKALESEHVSAHLHEWIDLIFGCKQKGPKAVEALNVFYYCSYEGAVDLDAITNPVEREAVEGMINNFGQTPSQLLKEPHPQRLSSSEALAKMLKSERKPDITMFLNKLTPITVEVSNDKDPVVFVSGPRSPPRGFLQTALPDCLVTVTRGGVVGVHSWLPYDRYNNRGFTFDTDPTMAHPKTRRSVSDSFHPSISPNSQLFCVSHDGKMLITAGHWDCSVRVYSLTKNKTLVSVIRHFDLVTCVALDQCSWYLASGSQDCTVVVWDISHLSSAPLRPVQTLYGHDQPVTTVAIATELDLVASGSKDGTVNIHSIHEGQYLRTLYPAGCDLGVSTEITYLAISAQGHVAFAANSTTNHSVHVFSVNGESVGSKYVAGRVTGLATAGDCLVVVDDAGDLTMSRLLGLYPVFDIPLHIPIQDVVVTPGNSHLLVSLQDGNIVVIFVPNS
ncbi:neurobeachin-like protein 1 [Macrosteles quadrilineatus]|uniref:neurobeachin-like protein 1 n=1 Tax=Macrosteles quadrilineatus TaxID=74068 RepID=UPI0023E11FD5|nr:neurobeachin-like protein 1 [Macrosteles quadrilineatus]